MTVIDHPAPGDVVVARFEPYRSALTGYCYRMLGSAFEAEDAVQETFVRAWRSIAGYEGRGSLEGWLYRIATNVCLNLLRGRQRRAFPVDLGPASPPSTRIGAAWPEESWVEPVPTAWVRDPADVAVSGETIRLAFVTALQHLPPRQRAVLILRDVLRWKADEVAELLDTSVVSIKSALQRARAKLAESDLDAAAPLDPSNAAQQELLDRYVDAFLRYDIDELVSLLHEDATLAMPPYELWLRGPADIGEWWRREMHRCSDSLLVPTSANGSPAVGQYRPVEPGGPREPFAIHVLDMSGGRIAGIHIFVDARLFPAFGLPECPES